MKVTQSPLPGVLILEPRVFHDNRGLFLEFHRQDEPLTASLQPRFVQDNHSRSSRVVRGEIFDVTVDVRVGSPHFGVWHGTRLDDQSMRMLYIPPGFAHGFLVLSETADVIYRCTDYYHAESEQGILWNDPDIDIQWPTTDVITSKKDAINSPLRDMPVQRLPSYRPE